jgi:hypothetical protein
MIRRAQTPMAAVVTYAGLFLVALQVSRSGACCGEQTIWASILTLPWSAVGVFVLDAIDPNLTGRFGSLLLTAGALVNVIMLYWLVRSWVRRAEDQESRSRNRPAA